MHSYKILLTYNDPLTLQTIGWALKDRGCDVISAPSLDQGIAVLRNRHFDVVLAELATNPKGGLSVLKEAKKVDPDTIVILLGNHGARECDMEKLPQEADEYVFPPCRIAKVWKRVTNCLERLELKRRHAQNRLARQRLVSLAEELERLGQGTYGEIGNSMSEKLAAMRETVKDLITQADRLIPLPRIHPSSPLLKNTKRVKDAGLLST